MRVILTMAGQGSRFKDAGYQEEKYAILFQGHSLFEWSLVSLRSFTDSPLTIVTRAWNGVESFVRSTARNFGFEDIEVVFVDHLTRGQAESASLAMRAEHDEPVLIFNTDTYLNPAALSPADVAGDGWIPYFPAEGDRWSFVELGSDGYSVTRTTEKERISPHCSVGLYYFRSSRTFLELMSSFDRTSGEWYIAPMYNTLISEGGNVTGFELARSDVHVLGTPEDLALAELQKLQFPG